MNLFDEFGLDNCKIELLENFPWDNKEQLRQREGYYIRNNDCVNKRIECRTRKEYKDEHKEDMRKYRIEHKEQIAQKAHEYRINNKESRNEYKRKKCRCDVCNGNYTQDSKAKHEKTNKHINALLCIETTGISCKVCGGCYSHDHKARHERTAKHQNSLKNLSG